MWSLDVQRFAVRYGRTPKPSALERNTIRVGQLQFGVVRHANGCSVVSKHFAKLRVPGADRATAPKLIQFAAGSPRLVRCMRHLNGTADNGQFGNRRYVWLFTHLRLLGMIVFKVPNGRQQKSNRHGDRQSKPLGKLRTNLRAVMTGRFHFLKGKLLNDSVGNSFARIAISGKRGEE